MFNIKVPALFPYPMFILMLSLTLSLSHAQLCLEELLLAHRHENLYLLFLFEELKQEENMKIQKFSHVRLPRVIFFHSSYKREDIIVS